MILMHPSVIRVGVIGERDEHVGQVAVAYIQVKTLEPGLEEQIRQLCERDLAAYKIPRKFIISTHTLPVTATGKVDKKVLGKNL